MQHQENHHTKRSKGFQTRLTNKFCLFIS